MKKTLDKKKLLEYPDAPSGSVYFYNYKEPLMPYVGGYGYIGALIHDEASDKLQCHLCGEWFTSLSNHINREHNTSAAEYRREVGLNNRTALVSETTRAKLIEQGRKSYEKSIKGKGRIGYMKGKKTGPRSAEYANNQNTCPEQLLERLRQLIAKLGRTPRASEIPFDETLRKVYGSTANALRIIGAQPRSTGVQLNHIVYTRAQLIKFLQDFKNRSGRKPSYSDCARKLLPGLKIYRKEFGKWSEAVKEAGV